MGSARAYWKFALWVFKFGSIALILSILSCKSLSIELIEQQPTPPKGYSYPPPIEILLSPSPTSDFTEMPPVFPSTMTPVPITPFPTLTLRPGPSPTFIPVVYPAQNASGTILFVAQRSVDSKFKLYSVDLDKSGSILSSPFEYSEVPIPSGEFIVPSPGGKALAITSAWGGLNIIKFSGDKFEDFSLNLGSEGLFLSWFPDNDSFLSGGGTLVLFDFSKGDRTVLIIPGYGGIKGGAASPDGQYIVFTYSTNTIYERGLWIVNSNGQNALLLVPDISPTNISWSPDGKRIAFFERGWQVVGSDGTDLREIASGITLPQCFFLPALWSPDSLKLAVVTSETGSSFCQGWTDDIFNGTNIELIDVESGISKPILQDGAKGTIDPTWSPDGTKLAFVSNRSGNPEIWVINEDGSELHQVTENYYFVRFPMWNK